jgi:2-haloacid dehalogenase
MPIPPCKALVFDVFGTVVDWRTCVMNEARDLAGRQGSRVAWGEFADAWRRQGYLAPIGEIVAGRRPYCDVEQLLDATLEELLVLHGIALDRSEVERLARVWRRLEPWPEVPEGLERLRRDYVIAPLSNGSFALLTEMAKRADLRWDCVISTELFETYKPDPRTYLGAARLLDVAPSELMLVAAHTADLRAAAGCGLRTAYVPRPLEWGPDAPAPDEPDPLFDVVAADFGALVRQLTPAATRGRT